MQPHSNRETGFRSNTHATSSSRLIQLGLSCGCVEAALQTLKHSGVKRTKILSIIASQQSVQRITEEASDTQIFVCAVDAELNSDKFIVPGLGDAGDRIFNT